MIAALIVSLLVTLAALLDNRDVRRETKRAIAFANDRASGYCEEMNDARRRLQECNNARLDAERRARRRSRRVSGTTDSRETN